MLVAYVPRTLFVNSGFGDKTHANGPLGPLLQDFDSEAMASLLWKGVLRDNLVAVKLGTGMPDCAFAKVVDLRTGSCFVPD